MIYSRIFVGIFFILFTNSGSTEETTERQINIKEALHTVGKFLRDDGGTIWLSSLTAGRSAPLTTDQLMVEILNSTDANEEVKTAANIIKAALEEKKISGSNETETIELEGWKDLVDNVEEQDDILCLYRKSLNVSSERTEDWQKFLKTMSVGYTVYLALDMGQKYVICLKKIQIPEQNFSTIARSLNLTELQLKIENSTDVNSSGSRSLNEKSDLVEENNKEEKCNTRNKIGEINMRRQFMPLRPPHQETPCNRPIIYMLPIDMYNWPQQRNYPGFPMVNSINLPSKFSHPGLPVMNPPYFASGPLNNVYPMVRPLSSPSGALNSDFLMRSAKPMPKLPSYELPMMNFAAYAPRPLVPGYPVMRSTAIPSRPKTPASYENLTFRKKLPDHSDEVQRIRQYPNRGPQGLNVVQAQTRGQVQPPRRFFQPATPSPKIIQPYIQPELFRLPESPSYKPHGSFRSFSVPGNNFEPFNYRQSPNFYLIQPNSPNQHLNSGCKNYVPCVLPCDKPLLVKLQIEPSQNSLKELSNNVFNPQSSQLNPWRRNMKQDFNIETWAGANKNDNKGVETQNSMEENFSDISERSESISNEVLTTDATINEGMD